MAFTGVESFDISGFPGEHIQQVWHEIVPLVELGLEYSAGEYEPIDIYQQIQKGTMQLWVAAEDLQLKGIILTEFLYFPRALVCQVVMAAGTTVERWEHCLDLIEHWAYEQGVTEMRAFARPGWKVKAQKHGYDMKYCVYRKPLRTDHAHTH